MGKSRGHSTSSLSAVYTFLFLFFVNQVWPLTWRRSAQSVQNINTISIPLCVSPSNLCTLVTTSLVFPFLGFPRFCFFVLQFAFSIIHWSETAANTYHVDVGPYSNNVLDFTRHSQDCKFSTWTFFAVLPLLCIVNWKTNIFIFTSMRTGLSLVWSLLIQSQYWISLVPRPIPFFVLQFAFSILHRGERTWTEEERG